MKETTGTKPKRSLILAGGGLKVAFQAGVLQVWLDEAGLKFDHVDAASGGVFNLAMMCQGMNGTAIADAWRRTVPIQGVSPNTRELGKLLYAESLFTLDAYREKVFPAWGLDWQRIRRSRLNASFNVCNFSTKELEVLSPRQMSEDFLVACVSLPMWFPPVNIEGQIYIDAVYMTDANIEEAIQRGADEVWVIWTVRDKAEWHDGFIANYFQIIETAAVGRYNAVLQRIERSNAALAAGEHSEFERHITVRELRGDVAMHYLLNLSQDRMTEAVNLGVKRAREWCEEQGIALPKAGQGYPERVAKHGSATLSFAETMRGYMGFGKKDFEQGATTGKDSDTRLAVHLNVQIDDTTQFVLRPEHDAQITGIVECPALGGKLRVSQGWFNLLTDQADASHKRMLYRLYFEDGDGRQLTFTGIKEVRDDPEMDLWTDTTTLYSYLLEGHVAEADDENAKVLAAGIIRIHMLDFMRQLTTFRIEGPSLKSRVDGASRFGRLFLGKLWDVYARNILTSGPV